MREPGRAHRHGVPPALARALAPPALAAGRPALAAARPELAVAHRAAALVVAVATLAVPSGALAQEIPRPDLTGAEPRVAARIESARLALEERESDAEAWGRYGMTLDAHRYAGPAAAAYRRAAELGPRDFRWAYYLGALLETSSPAEAAAWLERAVEIDPAYAPARIRLARTLEALDRRDQALAQYREAMRLAPADPLGYLGAGRIELAAGNARAAIELLERARERGPGIQAVVATLARAHQRAGDSDRAEALAAEARGLPRMLHHHDPRHAAVGAEAVDRESFLRRARTLVETGQAERARGELEELLRVDPADAEGWLALAGVLDRLGRADDALAAAQRAVEHDPDLRGGRAALAGALFETGRLAEAEREARAALAVDPDDVRLHLLTSMAAAARGDVGAATSHLDRAVAIGTTEPELRQVMAALLGELAGALAEVGRREEAARRLEQVLELDREAGATEAALAPLRARIRALRAEP